MDPSNSVILLASGFNEEKVKILVFLMAAGGGKEVCSLSNCLSLYVMLYSLWRCLKLDIGGVRYLSSMVENSESSLR